MRVLIVVLLAASLLTSACGRQDRTEEARASVVSETASGPDLTPEQLGGLGAKIRQSPEAAGAILEESGIDREQFEAAIRRLTEDPEASRRYAASFQKAGGKAATEIAPAEQASP